jgi:uncharacterized caspase-like protein/predicted small secreted protein
MKRHILTFSVLLLAAFLMSGCALVESIGNDLGNYGKMMGTQAGIIEQPDGTTRTLTAISDIDSNIPSGKKASPNDIAVVIGNKNYSQGVPAVDFAHRDAEYVREYLITTLGYDPDNILFEEDATLSTFNKLFGTLENPRGKLADYVDPNGSSNVFVYYVGHGAPDLESHEAYLVPSDADPRYLKSGGYKLDTLYGNLSKVTAKETVVVLDACFSGNSGGGELYKGVSAISLKLKAPTRAPKKLTVFSSSSSDQVSNWYNEQEHSLFTYYFLKGLGGEADSNKDRTLTAGEMSNYLSAKVPKMSRRLAGTNQTPTISGDQSVVLTRFE